MSIYKRDGSPYWQSEIDLRASGGRRSIRSTRETSRREAEAFDRAHRKEIEAESRRPRKSRLTLDDACGRYWIEKGKNLGWAEDVKRHLKFIVASGGEDLYLASYTTADVGQLVAYRLANGAGASGVNRTLAVCRQVLSRAQKAWGVEIQHIDWKAHWQAEPKGRVRWITLAEAVRLCSFLPAHIRLAVEWSLYTGCRREETFGLKWAKVNLERGYVEIRGKTGERIVWLSAETRAIIEQCDRSGTHVFDRTNWRKHWEAARKKAGIEDFHWHDLRHTHATWLRQGGAPLEIVARSLGHSTIQVTQRYAHVDDQEVRDAHRQLPSLSQASGNVVPMKGSKSQK
jgi:integrase